MKTVRRISRNALLLAISSALAFTPAMANPPAFNLSDLNYQSVDWAKDQLGTRGYALIHTDWHNNRNWSYWWQQSSRTCVKMQDDNRRVQAVETTMAMDCNQQVPADNNKSGMSSDAKAALGAAALLGVALLASKSHQRDQRNSQNEKATADFERGYRDGLHHERYHNYQNTTTYSDGYNAGQQKRDQETKYRSDSGRFSGYQPYVSLDDLIGARASSVDSDMTSRGFVSQSGYKEGNKSFTKWWNARTRQCVQSVTVEGRIQQIENIDIGNCT